MKRPVRAPMAVPLPAPIVEVVKPAPRVQPAPPEPPARVSCGECFFWELKRCHALPPSDYGEWPKTEATGWCGKGVKA